MSNQQKKMRVLWLGISMFVLMGLFPPMNRYFSFMEGRLTVYCMPAFAFWIDFVGIGLVTILRAKEFFASFFAKDFHVFIQQHPIYCLSLGNKNGRCHTGVAWY